MKIFMILLALAALIVPSTLCAQSSGDKYRVSTIAAFISNTDTEKANDTGKNTDKVHFIYVTQILGAESKVAYLGKMRLIEGMRRKMIDNYFTMVRHPELALSFKTEILVREGENQYWLPIEEAIISDFKSHVKTNSSVSIKYVWLGTVEANTIREWILAVRHFELYRE